MARMALTGLLLLCAAVLASAQTCGFKTSLTQDAISYLDAVGVQVLEKVIAGLQIPDLNGDAGTPIGHISWELSQISLTGWSISASSAVLNPGEGLTVSLGGVSVDLSGLHWHYREDAWPHVSDSGTADVYGSQVSASVSAQVSDDNTRPQIAITAAEVDIGDLSIHLHGGASWLYQVFVDAFLGKIKDALDGALRQAIMNNVANGVNQVLQQLPVRVPLGPSVSLSYALQTNPTVTSGYISLCQEGQVYANNQQQPCPSQYCQPVQLPDLPDPDEVNVVISDYLLQTTGYAFFLAGILQVDVYDSQLPNWTPIRLNTAAWKYLIPNLYAKYPDRPMMLHLACTQPPTASFAPTGALILAFGDITFNVIQSDNSIAQAFVLTGSASASGTALLINSGQTMWANMTFLTVDFTVKSTNVGPVDANSLDSLINLLFKDGIIPLANVYLNQGFPLPVVPGLMFSNSRIGWANHYLWVAADITYTPPAFFALRPKVLPGNETQPSKDKMVHDKFMRLLQR